MSVRRSKDVWIMLLVVSTASTVASADEPDRRPTETSAKRTRELASPHIGLRKQLFVDDFVVAEKQRVTRVLGQVTKANDGKPIFTDGWFYGTVLHDDGKFKLWFRKPDSKRLVENLRHPARQGGSRALQLRNSRRSQFVIGNDLAMINNQ